MHHGVQARRAIRAGLIAAAIVALTLAACVCTRACQTSASSQDGVPSTDGLYAGLLSGSLFAGKDVLEGLYDAGFSPIEDGCVPQWFVTEVLSCEEMGAGAAAPDFSTVGFFADGGAEQVLERLSKLFAERGWQGYASGVAGLATYTKEGGACSWMLAACVDVGDTTSVVLRIQHI